MATEIERKFLVDLTKLGELPEGQEIQQGYFETSGKTVVRARVKGGKAYLTIKGETIGATRSEFEYEIPVADAKEMIAQLCQQPVISKIRYDIFYAGHLWELDLFKGANEGLVIAEIELESEGQAFEKPVWVTQEVTEDSRYYNSNLIKHPYKEWYEAT